MKNRFYLFLVIVSTLLLLVADSYQMLYYNFISLKYLYAFQIGEQEKFNIPQTHPKSIYWLALRDINSGKYMTALYRLEERAKNGDWYAISLTATTLEKDGNYLNSIQLWKKIHNYRKLQQIASTALSEGRNEDEMAAYYALWELIPEGFHSVNLGEILLYQESDPIEAERVVRTSLEANPTIDIQPALLVLLGESLELQGRHEEAAEMYAYVESKYSDQANTYLFLGRLYSRKGAPFESIATAYQQAIFHDPENIWLYIEFGRALEVIEQYTSATEVYNKGIETIPNAHKLYYRSAINYRKLGELQLAVRSIEKALEIEPHSISYLRLSGTIFFESGQLGKAIQSFQTLLSLTPEDEYAQRQLDELLQLETNTE